MKCISTNKGFTLLEMLVALGVFTIVAVIAVGSLVRIVSLNRQAQTLQSSMSSLSYALEAISREMRVGTSHICRSGLPRADYWKANVNGDVSRLYANCDIDNTLDNGQSRMIEFYSQKIAPAGSGNTCHLIYAYLFKKDDDGKITVSKGQQSACGDAITFYPILDENNVTLTKFVVGLYRDTENYPYIFVRLVGYSGEKMAEQNSFDVQTSISARLPD